MATPDLHHEFDDELLSAYVDDELTPEERARVEARLQADPRAVQLVEELRRMSAALKSLPRESLDRSLRGAVLAAAEGAKGDRESPATIVLSKYGDDHRRGLRRGLVWSAMAIAAALALMFIQSADQRDGERSVAEMGAGKEKAVATSAPRTRNSLPEMGKVVESQRGAGGVEVNDLPLEAEELSTFAAGGAATPEMIGDEADGSLAKNDKRLSVAPPAPLPTDGEAPADSVSEFSFERPMAAPALAYRANESEPISDLSTAPATPTVELVLKGALSRARFGELLEGSDIDWSDAKDLEGAAAAAVPASGGVAFHETDAEAVLVDASPDQVAELIVRCREAGELFDEVKVDDAGDRGLGDLIAAKDARCEAGDAGDEAKQRVDGGRAGGRAYGRKSEEATRELAVPPEGGALAASRPEGLARSGQTQRGRARRVSPRELADMPQRKLAEGETRDRLAAAAARADADASGKSVDALGSVATLDGAADAKGLSDRQAAERVRVLFLFRAPALEAAEPAEANAEK